MLKKQLIVILFVFVSLVCSSCNSTESNSSNKVISTESTESIGSSSNLISSSLESSVIDENNSSTVDKPTTVKSSGEYELFWGDEFEYTGKPDSTKWGYDLGSENGGWGNNERQYYTDRLDNASVDNGNLTITAKKESYSGYQYTSARLVTKNNADFTYGYFEVKAKLASGLGTWPAIWMLPTDNVYGGWPNSGEIDIMEMVGKRPNHVLGSIHTRDYNWYNGVEVSKGGSLDVDDTINEYNTYGIEWTSDFIKFYINDEAYFTFSNNDNGEFEQWPFDQDFHFILNIAMGGTLGGNISAGFVETSMVVDYVRVYKLK